MSLHLSDEDMKKHKRNIYKAATNKRRAALAEQGICISCGVAPATDGRYCASCKAYMQARLGLRYVELEEQGLCIQCGKRPALEGKTRCAECTAKMNAYAREYMRKKRAAAKRAETEKKNEEKDET